MGTSFTKTSRSRLRCTWSDALFLLSAPPKNPDATKLGADVTSLPWTCAVNFPGLLPHCGNVILDLAHRLSLKGSGCSIPDGVRRAIVVPILWDCCVNPIVVVVSTLWDMIFIRCFINTIFGFLKFVDWQCSW